MLNTAAAYVPSTDRISYRAGFFELVKLVRAMESPDVEESLEASVNCGNAHARRRASELIAGRLVEAGIELKAKIIVPSSIASYQLASDVVWWHNTKLRERMLDESALSTSEVYRRELREAYNASKMAVSYRPSADSSSVVVSTYNDGHIPQMVAGVLARSAQVAAIVTLIDTRECQKQTNVLRTWGESIPHLHVFTSSAILRSI